MIATILCPGPSLAALTAERLGRPDVLLAVNTALDHPLAAGCAWWCGLDLWTPPNVLPRRAPTLGMVTCAAAISEGQATWVPYPLHDFRSAANSAPVRVTPSAAVYWAAELIRRSGGLGRIVLHGSEMRGTGHWNGVEDPHWMPGEWDLARADLRAAITAVGLPVEGAP